MTLNKPPCFLAIAELLLLSSKNTNTLFWVSHVNVLHSWHPGTVAVTVIEQGLDFEKPRPF